MDWLQCLRSTAHEISHMWFGNLVTMEFWDDLWLNEGFAKFIEFIVLDAVRPDLQVIPFFNRQIFAWALNEDVKAITHPVRQEVTSVYLLDELFDGITYNKGACVAKMFMHLAGDKFTACLKAYMEKY